MCPYFDAGTTGLVGTVGVTILDSVGASHVARTTVGITEPVSGSGTYYVAEHNAAETLTYVWDTGVGTMTASEMFYAGRESVPDILADTNELQVELADGGRTDLILDAIGTSVTEGTPQNVTADGTGTVTTGTTVAGNATATYLDDAGFWTTAPVTPSVGGFGLDISAKFLCGSKRASQVTINGRYYGTGRYADVYAYNYETETWDVLSDNITRMLSRSSDTNYTFILLSAHQKNLTVGDGEVNLSWRSPSTTTADRLYLDQILVKAVAAAATAVDIANAVYDKMKYTVYEGGVWVDTVNGVAGTALGVNGIPTNPVDTYADALTIAADLGVKRMYFKPGATVTLTADHTGWRFIGPGRIALNGQTIADAVFDGSYTVSGVGVGDDMIFLGCGVGPLTVEHSYFRQCMFKGDVTLSAADEYHLLNCSDAVAAGGVTTFVFAAGAELYARQWSGGIELSGMATGDSATIDGRGRVLIASNCAGGDVTIRGEFTITDSVIDGFEGTLTDAARWAEDQSIATVTDSSATTLLIQKLLRNKTITDPATGILTVFADNGTDVLFTANVYEDTAGTVPYSGQGAQRRDRLV